MKTNKKFSKTVLCLSAAFAVAMAGSMSGTSRAQDDTDAPMKPMKGGEHMRMLSQVTTVQEANALKQDDTMAMVCAKCKTVYITRVKQGMKGAELLKADGRPTELIGTHECPGCKGTWTITGVGKGATTELKHSCSKCGDDSAFCCATTTNQPPTKGMESEEK